jgi:hypothetical protein
MNTYSKYTANVFVAKCKEIHEKGETIFVETKYGKENECIVFNLVHSDKEGNFYYSIVRADGLNYQDYCNAKAERYQGWANSREQKSNQYYQASKEGKDFLSLAEPIKIGHHSEKSHRALINRNSERMRKSLENEKVAIIHESKADYWSKRSNDINLSMPESIEYYEYKLEAAKEYHEGLKSGIYERKHSFSLTYAKKEANKFENLLKDAFKLWGE